MIAPSGKDLLSLEGALNFDEQSLLSPCADEETFTWYKGELGKWIQVLQDPASLESDVVIINDVK